MEVSVASVAQTSTTTDALAQTSTDGDSATTQSYVISAKNSGGSGAIDLSVEKGLPDWMKVESTGNGTLKMTGERPEGDAETYRVEIKIKRPDGEEVTVVVTVEPVAAGDGGSDAGDQQATPAAEDNADGQSQEGQETGAEPQNGPAQEPAAPQSQTYNNLWIEQLLAELAQSHTDGQPIDVSQMIDTENAVQNSTFTSQIASANITKEAWLLSVAG